MKDVTRLRWQFWNASV